MESIDRLLTTRQAAEKLGCCKLTLLRKLKQNGIGITAYQPTGKGFRFKESEVNAYLEGKKVVFDSEPVSGSTLG